MAQWNVTDAVFLQEFSVAAKEITPTGVCFKPDGTKMYTIGLAGDTVDEYDLGTQWDVTTAVFLQEFSVTLQDIYPRDVCFKPDGTKMYIVGSNTKNVCEYDLGTQWDVSSAVYLQAFSVVAKETDPRGLYFKPDGTKMYTMGLVGIAVDEYDLGKQWDVTTAVWLQEFSVAPKELEPQGLYLKPDGAKMYVIGMAGDTVDEYDLGAQWDVSTAVYLREFSVAVKETDPRGVCFKPDGTKMYTIGSDGDTVDEYDLL